MSAVTSHVLQRALNLPEPRTRELSVDHDLRIPLPDGGALLADRHYPAAAPGTDAGTNEPTAGSDLPVLLFRSPYGRAGFMFDAIARIFAERGFQVLVASQRGTFGSSGEFNAMHDDRADGAALMEWMRAQPWFSGTVALAGPSYLGYTQWALAVDAYPEIKAMVPHETSSRLALAFLEPGATQLDTMLRWSVQVAEQEQGPGLSLGRIFGEDERRLQRAMGTLPLKRADRVRLRRDWPFFQETLHHDNQDPHWAEWDYSGKVAGIEIPASFVAGWYDIFLKDQLGDFTAMQDAGRAPRISIGPWTHTSPGTMAEAMRETLDWAGAHCAGTAPSDRAPVRLYVMGAGEWRGFDQWPPVGGSPASWFLRSEGRLTEGPATEEAPPTRYRYDPADPTPSVGGPLLGAQLSGRKDNRSVEARDDVLTFTSTPLEADVEVIGEVTATVWLRSSLEHTDLFARLCEVDERGRSFNICDGLTGITPENADRAADGTVKVHIRLSPTAHRFRAGRGIRVQVSSGAHPYFARNPGTGEHRADATRLRPADQEVFHDAEHPSAIELTVHPVD